MPSLTMPTFQERVTFLGSNGSGKSLLASYLLDDSYQRAVIIDLKHDFTPGIENYTLVKKPQDWRWAWRRHGHILYRPSPDFLNGGDLSYVLKQLYFRAQKEGKKKPFIIYIDETLFLSKLGANKWLSALAVSGRSMGVGLWCASQRPRWIPLEVRSETWRWYVFTLDYDDDVKEFSKYTQGRISQEELRNNAPYSFWEIKRADNGGSKAIHHYPPIRVKEAESGQ